MYFQTLLVHGDLHPTPDPRLALAADRTNQFNAKLIGIGTEIYRIMGMGSDFGSTEIYKMLVADLHANLGRAKKTLHLISGSKRHGS